MDALGLVYLTRSPGAPRATIEALEARGFTVTVADLDDAQACLEAVDPEATIVDLGRAGDAGVEIVAWIRATDPWRDRPCFVQAADADQKARLDRDVGGVRFAGEDLPGTVAEAFRGRTGFKVSADGGRGVSYDGDVMIV